MCTRRGRCWPSHCVVVRCHSVWDGLGAEYSTASLLHSSGYDLVWSATSFVYRLLTDLRRTD